MTQLESTSAPTTQVLKMKLAMTKEALFGKNFLRHARNVIGVVIIAVVMYVGTKFPLEYVFKYLSPWVALVLAVLPIGTALAVVRIMSRDDDDSRRGDKPDAYTMLGLFAFVIALGIVGFAAFSYARYQMICAQYVCDRSIYLGDFVDFYIWHSLKMLPIGIEDAWGQPLKQQGRVAGVSLVAFRILLILPLLAAYKKWSASKDKKIGETEPPDES